MGSIVIVLDPEGLEIIAIISAFLYFVALITFVFRTYQYCRFPFTIVHWLLIGFTAFRTIDFLFVIPSTISVIFNDSSSDFAFLWLAYIIDALVRPVIYIAFFLSVNRWVGKIQAAKGDSHRPRQSRRLWSMEVLMWSAMVTVSCIGIIEALQNIFQWIFLVDITQVRLVSFLVGFYFTWFIGYLVVTVFLNAVIVLYYLRHKFVALASQFCLLAIVSSLLFLPVIFDFADAFSALEMIHLDGDVGNGYESIYFLLGPLPEIVIIFILALRADEFGAIVRLRKKTGQPLEILGA